MASRMSSREKKLLKLSPNKKVKEYGTVALEYENVVNKLVDLQELLILKSFTNEVDDNEITETYNKAMKDLESANNEFKKNFETTETNKTIEYAEVGK